MLLEGAVEVEAAAAVVAVVAVEAEDAKASGAVVAVAGVEAVVSAEETQAAAERPAKGAVRSASDAVSAARVFASSIIIGCGCICCVRRLAASARRAESTWSIKNLPNSAASSCVAPRNWQRRMVSRRGRIDVINNQWAQRIYGDSNFANVSGKNSTRYR